MIEQNQSRDGQAAREWMENSRFSTVAAGDIFEAFEEMGDFTTGSMPDVIMLDVESCKADLPIIRGTLEAIHDSEVSIMALSELSESSVERGAFEGNLEAVVAHLDELLPETVSA